MGFASEEEKKPRPGPRLKRDRRLVVRAETLDANGAGVARLDGAQGSGAPFIGGVVVHVAGLLPGEEAEVAVAHQSPHTGEAWATLVWRRNAAPGRVVPVCPRYGTCGGCVMQHLSYPAQLEWKRGLLVAALERAGVVPDDPVPACVATPPTFAAETPDGLRYRNRAKLVASLAAGESDGRVILGAYAPRSHRVIDMAGCRLVEPVLDRVAGTLADLAGRLGARVYQEHDRAGRGLRYVLLRNNAQAQVQVSLVVADSADDPLYRALALALATALRDSHTQAISGVLVHENRERGNVLLPAGSQADGSAEPAGGTDALPERLLLGEAALWDQLGPVRLRVSPHSFLQINRAVAARIYADVAEALAPRPGDRLLDLYCGVGGIALTLWHHERQLDVLGIEEGPAAVADALAAAQQAGMPAAQARFVRDDAGQALAKLSAAGQPDGHPGPPTLAVFNPPRRGCDPAVLDQVAALRPRALAYVSCDPDTLARDLARLASRGYRLVRATPYDMHPHTPHVESVAWLALDSAQRSGPL